MPYTSNPNIPKVRRDAAQMVYKGHTPTEVGRRFGVGSSTICKWVKKAKIYGYHPIPTLSSKPKHHPRQLSNDLVWKIFHQRIKSKRCAEVVHQELLNQKIVVSLSSVKRTLDRTGLLKKRSPWKRYHPHQERPQALEPGDLVEIDTIHLMVDGKKRIYIYTLIDTYSRWVYAKAYKKINGRTSLKFVKEAQQHASFQFKMLQSDHGPEFGDWFVEQVKKSHRYTRIGKPNDNSHIERFNRTLQEECVDRVARNVWALNKALRMYLKYYNNERLHMGILLRAPMQLITNPVQAID
ncbi:MAG: integrase core domain-containing protein [Candidatus Paceibacterota bacterium]|jgi:putative transposase